MATSPSTEGTAQIDDSRKTWFDHMTGYLKWKILGPDINNPFKSPLPLHQITRMANQRDYLAQHVQIRCLCDGYEVMIIANPGNPRIISSHPCISTMPQEVIVDYINRTGLDEFINNEIDRIGDEIRDHLKSRSKGKEEQTAILNSKKDGKTTTAIGGSENKKSANESKDSSKTKAYRILKR
jgi:hypothetical protein